MEGLSFLGSVIGNPFGVDNATAKIEILPYAKMCVDYRVGVIYPLKLKLK